MGGRRVSCIVCGCKMYTREQRTRGFLILGRQGLYSFDVDIIKEVAQKAGFCYHICIHEGMD